MKKLAAGFEREGIARISLNRNGQDAGWRFA
jgi:hypothetical protein